MPSKTTYTKTLRDWELLLSAVAENAGAMPEAEELRAALTQHMTRAREIKALQDTAKSSRQQHTQDLKAELA